MAGFRSGAEIGWRARSPGSAQRTGANLGHTRLSGTPCAPTIFTVMFSAASLPEVSHPEVRRRNPALRILYYGVCLLVMVLILGTWWLYWMARDAVPQVEGKAVAAGLSAQVRVVRDEHGVPTIEASTLEDLFVAQGYV